MGGAVSSGRDNNELVDNLMGGNYIRTDQVAQVFRAVDRADYMLSEARDQAYKDLAWKDGPIHLSAPCIYSEVMEGLDLRKGLSFLNVGSGTGYLSTLVGLILGSGGISHGIEVNPVVLEYCNKRLKDFMENSAVIDEMDFCVPKYFLGNGLCVSPLQASYDRVYCGAGCPEKYKQYFQHLIKVGGVLVMPLNDNLLRMRRESLTEWKTSSLLHVSFAQLRPPHKAEAGDLITLEELSPPPLQTLCRASVRASVRAGVLRARPDLVQPPRPVGPRAPGACPRRICIPIDDDSDIELTGLHDLDPNSGSNEMNALLSLVLSMGHNRVAGSLRFDAIESSEGSDAGRDTGSDSDDTDPDDIDGGSGDGGAEGGEPDGSGRIVHERRITFRPRPARTAEDVPGTSQGAERRESETETDDGRRKPDSGIGEENSPGGSPSSPETESRTCDSEDSEMSSDSVVGRSKAERPRKRTRRRVHSSDSSSEARRPRVKKRASAKREEDADGRRERLSILVREGLQRLPLPHALKHYVNYGRAFD